MDAVLLRRRRLGKTSCDGISDFSKKDFVVLRNDKVFPKDTPLVFRWGCTSDVPENVAVVNTAKAIHLVNNKTEFRKILDKENLCTKTFFSVVEAVEKGKYPFVVRPSVHAQGRNLFLCENYHQLVAAAEKCGYGYYINEYVKKTAEYRVFVASGRAVWVAQKTPGNPEDVAWNVAKGGRFDNVRWDNWRLKVVKIAIKAFSLSGLDFGGVDVMVDEKDKCFVLEINSAPSQTSPYRQECVAKVFDYIVDNGKKSIPLIEEPGGYLKFIHPAVEPKARLKKEDI